MKSPQRFIAGIVSLLIASIPIASARVIKGPFSYLPSAIAQTDSIQPALYRQQEAELAITGGIVKGTLFTPATMKRPPVVLIIAGSGPTDRDGNSPLLPGKNNS